MHRVENIIERCRDRKRQHRDPETIKGVMVHRCGVDLQTGVVLGYDAASVSDAFTGRAEQWTEVAKATGGQNAYSFMVGGDLGPAEFDGQIWQLLEIDEIGWHGRRFSGGYIGVSLIGDFRHKVGQPASPAQLSSLIWLVSSICAAFDIEAAMVLGHGEVAGAHGGTKAPGEPAACPGDYVDMDRVRSDVAHMIGAACSAFARDRLLEAGAFLG